ncbi:hypothetical protein PICST_52289 [Scheffersomyces stipitis CBS 6054]|uniref:Replication termination factor 2 n=1 Tax=Scheffersomyces stipitis (strain ATCC 58785 / CBS 6054 / NBRC 10063 / NRRL Y-11545) TaxID=322104 RepID=A3GFU0_PICST|nr:predicted protein [Scheffersomyces stipitis CBS 6054]EAZ63403.2 hypothetical protein PICST_52289 [Scheffersomyces stipitis CBS 6054]KAG2735734.1 hypothetical protein G9P44_001948 [Scheffersomyces stipitis]
MGNDGGTIAKRSDLLALHSRNVEFQKADDNEASLITTCAISSLPLYSEKEDIPIVGDYKGRLYRKEKILEYILSLKLGEADPDKSEQYNYIRSLKDLVDVKVKWTISNGTPYIQCPVTMESKQEKISYAYLRTCGCVLSFKLLEDLAVHFGVGDEPIKSECPNCGEVFHFNYDIVVLNPLAKQQYNAWNDKNYVYITETLKRSHAKQLKKKSKSDSNAPKKRRAEKDSINKKRQKK